MLRWYQTFYQNCKPLIPNPDFLLIHCSPLQTIRPRPFKGVLIILPKLWPLYKTKNHLLFLLPNLCPRGNPVLHLLILATLSVSALQRYPQASCSMTPLPSFSPPFNQTTHPLLQHGLRPAEAIHAM